MPADWPSFSLWSYLPAILGRDAVGVVDELGSGDLLAIVGDRSHVVTVADSQGAARLGVKSADARNDSALLRFAATRGRKGLYTPRVDQVVALTETESRRRCDSRD